MTTRNSLVTTGDSVDGRNLDGTREQVGLAPQPVSSVRKKPNKSTVRPLGGTFKPQAEPAAPPCPSGACNTTGQPLRPNHLQQLNGMFGSGVWCNAQVLNLVRAGEDLVRRRRSPARSQPIEPRSSTRQNCTPNPGRVVPVQHIE